MIPRLASLTILVAAGLLGYPTGAPVGHSGAPRDHGTCGNIGCHFNPVIGTSLRIRLEDAGVVYQPGHSYVVAIDITDVSTLYGFQLTARFARDPIAQAGTFEPLEGETVLCASTDLSVERPRRTATCPVDTPLEYIGHGLPAEQHIFRVRWTAPVTPGDVIFYAAGNAANGDTTRAGDRIHSAQLHVTTAAGSPSPSAILTATAFSSGGTAIAPQAWVEIYGERLAPRVETWSSVIASGNAPTELAGVRVLVDGSPAFLSYVSPGQINLQVPDGIPSGERPLSIGSGVTVTIVTVPVAIASPGVLAPPAFRIGNRQFTAAQHPDGVFVGPPAFFGSAVSSRSAHPGDRILLWAIGLGPVNPAQPAGRAVTQANALGTFVLRFGTQTVAAEYAGLAPGSIGLYQINAVVPELPPGEYEISGELAGGTTFPAGIFINLR